VTAPRRIALAGGELLWWPGFLDAAEAARAFLAVRDEVPWERHTLRLYGRDVAMPRLSCWIGDADAVYAYSGARYVPRAWTPTLAALRERVAAACGVAFDSVLANRYRDGRDAMGWHADDEPELGPAPVIASLSLGAARRFRLRRKDERTTTRAIELTPGSLLVMQGATQTHWQHALPRTAKPVGERINLTFRKIVGRTPRTA
jgi:alkylated DNA repair dioxygenase AlkB